MIIPTLIDLIAVELNYYLFTISPDKCNGSCTVYDDSSTKILVPSETKDINVKVFTMITIICEIKNLIKHISYACKCKLNSTKCN